MSLAREIVCEEELNAAPFGAVYIANYRSIDGPIGFFARKDVGGEWFYHARGSSKWTFATAHSIAMAYGGNTWVVM